MIQIYSGSFGDSTTCRPSAKVRRLSKRRLKKRVARDLQAVWNSSVSAPFAGITQQRIGSFSAARRAAGRVLG